MNTPHGLFKYLPSHIMRAMVSLDESVLAQVTEVRFAQRTTRVCDISRQDSGVGGNLYTVRY